MKTITWQIARTFSEAKSQAAFVGYESKADAKKALADPKIDDYYRQKLHIFRVETGKGKIQ